MANKKSFFPIKILADEQESYIFSPSEVPVGVAFTVLETRCDICNPNCRKQVCDPSCSCCCSYCRGVRARRENITGAACLNRRELLEVVRNLSDADRAWIRGCLAADDYEEFLELEKE